MRVITAPASVSKMKRVKNYIVLSTVPDTQLSAQNVREQHHNYSHEQIREPKLSAVIGKAYSRLLGNRIKPNIQVPVEDTTPSTLSGSLR